MESSIHSFDGCTGATKWRTPIEAPDAWYSDASFDGIDRFSDWNLIGWSTLGSVDEEAARKFANSLGQYSHLDIDANNVILPTEGIVAFTTKGGAVGHIDAQTGKLVAWIKHQCGPAKRLAMEALLILTVRATLGRALLRLKAL